MKLVLIVLVLVAVSGCTIISDKVAQGIILYCSEPYAERLLIRELVNADLTARGHRIQVHCYGDPQ